MKADLSIGQIAQRCSISRTTVLYYERAGVLGPARRTASGYRQYGEADVARLQDIRRYRAAGMPLTAIAALLSGADKPSLIRTRLEQVGRDIAQLQEQQAVLLRMLASGVEPGPTMDKARWSAMLAAVGLDKEAMRRWHSLFEQQAPAAHERFLYSLGLGPEEVARIRKREC